MRRAVPLCVAFHLIALGAWTQQTLPIPAASSPARSGDEQAKKTEQNPPPKLGDTPDPYKSFRYRVSLDGRYVAGFTVMKPLPPSAEPHRPNSPSTPQAPQRTKWDSVTLSRGVTHDDAFEQWAASTRGGQPGPAKDLIIDVFNEMGHKVTAYILTGCVVTQYQAAPDLDAGANAVSVTALELKFGGWKQP
jgi:phage tail-like protein